ncbi:MAG: GTPase [Nanoarchaeota archaeon]|nr:GTPase [Nanoarchaeota archaeon]
MRTAGPPEIHNRHKISFPAQVKNIIRISDIVLEIVDARYITESRIPELEEIIKEQEKMLVHVVTKIDLVDVKKLKESEQAKDLSNPVFISCKTKEGIKNLRERIHILAKKFKDRERVHIGVIGYPNTGKSSVISILARRAAAPVSSQSGFTKSMSKIRFSKGILLLDGPGVVPTKENLFGDQDLKKHALLGVHVPESVRNPDLIVFELMKMNPGRLEKHYDIESEGDVEKLLQLLGERWIILKKKGEVDSDKTARRILKDWHTGKIKG